jgi:hypothetical protein
MIQRKPEERVTHALVAAAHWPRSVCGLSSRFVDLVHANDPTCETCRTILARRLPGPVFDEDAENLVRR